MMGVELTWKGFANNAVCVYGEYGMLQGPIIPQVVPRMERTLRNEMVRMTKRRQWLMLHTLDSKEDVVVDSQPRR